MTGLGAILLSVLRSIGIRGGLLVAVAAFAAWQTVRIEGLKIWPVSIDGLKVELAEAEARYEGLQEDYMAAQDFAAEEARAVRERDEQRYRDLKENYDARIELAEDAAQLRTDRYIADNRLRGRAGASCGASGATGAASEGGAAQGGNRSDPDTELVGVTARDVKICTSLYTRLIGIRSWALEAFPQQEND